jgi:hypothetical protein
MTRFWVLSRRARLRATAIGTVALLAILVVAAASVLQHGSSLVLATSPPIANPAPSDGAGMAPER